MDRITFKNFRKFKDETTFELNDINILVGPNNSGKSTLTKGIRLYLYNIQNLKVNDDNDNTVSFMPFFDFGGNVFSNPHVGTFGRALSKNADEDEIHFSMLFYNTFVDTTVSRFSVHCKDAEGNPIDYFDSTSAPITQISFYNTDYDAAYIFDFEKECFHVIFNYSGKSDYYGLWKSRIEEYNNKIQNLKNSSEIEWYEDVIISPMEKSISFGIKDRIYMTMELDIDHISEDLYKGLFVYAFELIDDVKNGDCDCVIDEKDKHVLGDENFYNYYRQINNDISNDFNTYVKDRHTVVIEAHSVTHSLVYNISDKNDYMAQTILDYKNQNIKDTDPENLFIKNWMTKFNIGEDFIIESFGGECFKFEIIEDIRHPEERTPLLDKGVGSNQIMILLLRLATLMRQNIGATIPCTIIIEEPEQNLHPKLQSLLADLFYEVYQYPKKTNKDSWGISFLVETHSEYLVRRSQVLVAKMFKEGSEDIPISVFYVTGDNKMPSYEMGFQKNGKFEKSFGKGFYDVSDDAAMELFDLDNEDN